MARALGVEIDLATTGHSEEYIQFRSVDATMRERFGVAPTISFADGVARLQRFLCELSAVVKEHIVVSSAPGPRAFPRRGGSPRSATR